MKNLKGFLKREDKPLFHHVGINEAVVELNKIIKPSLNLVDFTAPVQKHSGFVLAGNDIIAVDAVSTSIMGLSTDDIKTIQLGYQAGLGEMNLAKIDIKGEDIKGLKNSGSRCRAFKELEDKGWIKRTERGGLYRHFNEYELTGEFDPSINWIKIFYEKSYK